MDRTLLLFAGAAVFYVAATNLSNDWVVLGSAVLALGMFIGTIYLADHGRRVK